MSPRPARGDPEPTEARSEPCANCGTGLAGAYCHRCGQEAGETQPSLGAFLAESLRDLLHFRSRTLRSLRCLLLRPGELTRAYLEGRRVRYTSPVKLYLISAAVFFLVNEYRPFVVVTADDRVVSSLSASDVVAAFSSEIRELEARGVSRELFWERFRSTASRSLPQFMVGSIALFALALALFTPGGSALGHVVFSLHWTAFFLLFMSVERLLPSLGGPLDPIALGFSLGLLAHLVVSLRRGYGHSWRRAVPSGLGLFLVFNAILGLWVMAVVGYAVRNAA